MGGVNRSLPDWLDDERLTRVAWNRLADPGDVAAARLRERLGVREALRAVYAGLWSGAELAKLAARWEKRLDGLDPVRDIRHGTHVGARVVIPGDPEWPAPVDDLGTSAPVCLWLRGPGRPDWSRAIGVVGARASTNAGEQTASTIAAGVVDYGVTVVSGGAYGIDAAAHRGALAAAAGSPAACATVAVLAGGPDRLYPRSNEPLLKHLGEQYLLITEAPCGTEPTRWRFLERNRLIAALGRALVVVEAGARSGALNTVNHAEDPLSRRIGAVPGPVTSAMSFGTNELIRTRRAEVVTNALDALFLAPGLGPARLIDQGPSLLEIPDDPVTLRVFDALPRMGGISLEKLSGLVALSLAEVDWALDRLVSQGRVVKERDTWRRARNW